MASLSLRRLTRLGSPEAPQTRVADDSGEDAGPAYQSVEDVYRQKWRWDKGVKGTPLINCWYQRSCAFNLYVKDGVVLREEKSGEYPQTNAAVPDFNPRGCEKAA